jgi:hypothetical protein
LTEFCKTILFIWIITYVDYTAKGSLLLKIFGFLLHGEINLEKSLLYIKKISCAIFIKKCMLQKAGGQERGDNDGTFQPTRMSFKAFLDTQEALQFET